MYPEMTTPRKLEPFGRADYKAIDKQRGNERTKFIKPDVWDKILETVKNEKKGDPEIVPNLLLCYSFGFRINETLGLTKDKFFADFVLVDEQGGNVVDNGGDRELTRVEVKTTERQVPYWNMTAKEAWALVKQIKVMHPHTLTKRVNEVLGGFGHKSHDLRRTFITNAFRSGKHWKDVQRAAGHKDVRTTMAYDQDDRGFRHKKADLDD
ncbi:MAG: hypothetical protein C5B49_03775 [Bdellovibrio sp.]|nr:MAG: hypothetical protein C5B49_03775 [Bdellovibrio sp.]